MTSTKAKSTNPDFFHEIWCYVFALNGLPFGNKIRQNSLSVSNKTNVFVCSFSSALRSLIEGEDQINRQIERNWYTDRKIVRWG